MSSLKSPLNKEGLFTIPDNLGDYTFSMEHPYFSHAGKRGVHLRVSSLNIGDTIPFNLNHVDKKGSVIKSEPKVGEIVIIGRVRGNLHIKFKGYEKSTLILDEHNLPDYIYGRS